jgi:serine/threonine protein kinase
MELVTGFCRSTGRWGRGPIHVGSPPWRRRWLTRWRWHIGRGWCTETVKPGNILVEPTGRARLIDFDLAVRTGMSAGEVAAGTFTYSAPEQSGDAPSTGGRQG